MFVCKIFPFYILLCGFHVYTYIHIIYVILLIITFCLSVSLPLSIGVVGWCDGAGYTSSAGASYNLDYSRARAYCAYSRCGWGLFGHFYSHLSFLSSFSLSLGDGPIKTEILSQRAVKPKTTNQPSLEILCTPS